VAIYSTFLQRAYDQIIHDVCIQGLPVIFAIDRAGIVGDDGKTHQGIFDLSFLRCVPGMTIAAPADGQELARLLGTAVAARRPFAIRYPRGTTTIQQYRQKQPVMPLGRGEVLRAGDHCALLALGSTVAPAMAAADLLNNSGIDCAVANMRFVKPLDRELLVDLAGRTGLIITVEENTAAGGLGSAVLEALNDETLTGVRIHRIALGDEFIEHGTQAQLRTRAGLDAAGIARQVWPLCSEIHRENIKQRAGV
jgi:1-deoxy-D-xylulose-5-phosphate synthase